MSSQNNYREFFELYTKLFVSLGGKNPSEISQRVSAFVSESAKSKTIHDESTLLSAIIKHLTATQSASEANAFRISYDRLVHSMEPKSRTAMIAFLFFMADTKKSGTPTTSINSKGVDVLASGGRNFFSNKITSSDSYQNVPTASFMPSSQISSSISDNQLNIRQRLHHSVVTNSSASRDDLDLHVNQRKLAEDLVQEVIYSFTGIQGKYLKKDIISGGFKLDAKAGTLSATDAGMLMRLAQLGYYHNHVQSYTDPKSGKGPMGLLGQGLVTALKDELTKYYGMIAMLQEQLNRSKQYDSAEQITLMKVMLWIVEPMHRLQWLNTICEACQEKKGGDLATIVSNFRQNGDPMVKSLVNDLLLATCRPLKHMLSKWLLEGEIEDPHSEFFVEILPDVGIERLWSLKYRVRTSMLPCFISNKLANKILVTGKSINFLREICQDTTPISGKEDLKQHFLSNKDDDLVSFIPDTKLHTLIDNVYYNTSKKVLDIVVDGHKLLHHLQAMKNYLLLGQGDFIGTLMESIKSQLDRPCKELHIYELNSILDAAIRSTTAKYDDPDITNQLTVSMLHDFHTDRGWDVFTLHYTVRGPLSTMLEPSMIKYHMLFKRLWALKHVEYVVCSKLLRSMKQDLDAITYPLQLYTSTMIHFIQQIQYYILFEVIECSWTNMLERIEKARALDDILEAHQEFLKDAHDGAFFNKNASIFSTMDSAFAACLKLEKWQENFYDLCMKELNARKAEEEMIRTSGAKGKYGLTADKRLERDQERKVFEECLPKMHGDLKVIGKDFETHVRTVLLALASSNDHNLQLFGTRLDFNEYYKKRDQNLDAPLSFGNIRHSNIRHSSMMQRQRNSNNRYNN